MIVALSPELAHTVSLAHIYVQVYLARPLNSRGFLFCFSDYLEVATAVIVPGEVGKTSPSTSI